MGDSQTQAEKNIEVDEEVIDFIKQQGQDYRVCTSCFGAVILPVTIKHPKPSDIRIKIGDKTLYISRVQASYITQVDKSMLSASDADSCLL